jgi:hypothetical protein
VFVVDVFIVGVFEVNGKKHKRQEKCEVVITGKNR